MCDMTHSYVSRDLVRVLQTRESVCEKKKETERVCVRVRVCACVREREREKERERERWRERWRARVGHGKRPFKRVA